MAREISDIEAEIDAAKAADPTLSVSLTSVSAVAIYKLWRSIIAIAFYSIEKIFDAHKTEVTLLAERSEYGSAAWYVQKALEFQYGDVLAIVNGVPAYPIIDETKQIIKRATANDGPSGGLIIKVAKSAGTELTSLSAAEKAAFSYYLNKVKFAGIYTSVISLTADLLKGSITVYHNGERDVTELTADLDAAVAVYLSTLDFDGKFIVIKLIDQLQQLSGVDDVVVASLMSKEPGDIYKNIVRNVSPASGYFKLDAGAGSITWTLVAP